MILDTFKSKLIEYAKAHQTEQLGVLRFFLAQVQNKEIELRPQNKEVTDEVVYKVLKKLIKQTDETIELSQKAGRSEAVAKSEGEKQILNDFISFFSPEFLQQQAEIEQNRQQYAKKTG